MIHKGEIIWQGPASDDRHQRQSLCRPIHPRPRRRPDPDGRAEAPDHRWQRPRNFVCQSCGAVSPQMGRTLRQLRRMEHHRRGGSAAAGLGRQGRKPAERPRSRARRPQRRHARPRPRIRDRHRRTRPGGGRRLRGGLRRPDRRRSRHRQIDAPAAGPRRARRARRARHLCLGRGRRSRRSGLRAERLGLRGCAVLLAAETNVSDILATLSEGEIASRRRDRFDPDPVVRRSSRPLPEPSRSSRRRRKRSSASPSRRAPPCCSSAM